MSFMFHVSKSQPKLFCQSIHFMYLYFIFTVCFENYQYLNLHGFIGLAYQAKKIGGRDCFSYKELGGFLLISGFCKPQTNYSKGGADPLCCQWWIACSISGTTRCQRSELDFLLCPEAVLQNGRMDVRCISHCWKNLVIVHRVWLGSCPSSETSLLYFPFVKGSGWPTSQHKSEVSSDNNLHSPTA